LDVQLVFLSCWFRDSSNKRTYISSFFIFFLIDSIKYGWIPKTAKEHASVLQGPFVCYHIVWEHTLKNLYCTMSVQFMKEKWLFTMLNVKIISPLLWNLLLPDSSNNFFVGWTLGGSTWLLTHPDSLKLLFFYMFRVFRWLNVTFKCTLPPILLMLISFIHTLHDAALNLFCIWDRHLYSGFSSHLILKEQFPAILWQKLQHAVFVCGSCHF
jgi:hypothetical protein